MALQIQHLNLDDPSGYFGFAISSGGATGLSSGPYTSNGYYQEASSSFGITFHNSTLNVIGIVSSVEYQIKLQGAAQPL